MAYGVQLAYHGGFPREVGLGLGADAVEPGLLVALFTLRARVARERLGVFPALTGGPLGELAVALERLGERSVARGERGEPLAERLVGVSDFGISGGAGARVGNLGVELGEPAVDRLDDL